MIYFFIVAISYIIGYLITPNIRHTALKFYVIDKANHRKIHRKIVTKLGGLAIYLGFLGGVVTVLFFDLVFLRTYFVPLAAIVMTSSLILILGIYDDFQGSSAVTKLLIQSIVASLLIKSGFLLTGISIPNFIQIQFGVLSVPLTIVWLVGVTNAINLIDGLDGLAAGICIIALAFICTFGFIWHHDFITFLSLAILGSCMAFLKYNFYPAKIFMGDTGSLFLGMIIASLAIYRPNPGSSNNPYFIPTIFLLILPITDTLFAIVRRLLRKQHIFRGDSSHIHHYFLKLGFNQPQIVKRFYFFTFVSGLIALLFSFVFKQT